MQQEQAQTQTLGPEFEIEQKSASGCNRGIIGGEDCVGRKIYHSNNFCMTVLADLPNQNPK